MIVALLYGRVEESNVLHGCIIIPVRSAISDFTQLGWGLFHVETLLSLASGF